MQVLKNILFSTSYSKSSDYVLESALCIAKMVIETKSI